MHEGRCHFIAAWGYRANGVFLSRPDAGTPPPLTSHLPRTEPYGVLCSVLSPSHTFPTCRNCRVTM